MVLGQSWANTWDLPEIITKAEKKIGGMAKMVENLSSKNEDLSSNQNQDKKKKMCWQKKKEKKKK
jgi:Sec-independent protein translocase protein TatA